MMKVLVPVSMVVLASTLLLAGCDVTNTSEAQAQFEVEALDQSPSGITRTTAEGEVVTEDADDWRTAPIYAAGRFELDGPPFPNPYSQTSGLVVSGFIDGAAGGELTLRRLQPNGTLILLDRETLGSGRELFVFIDNGAWFANIEIGLQRLVVLDGQGRVVTYGDVQVE